MNPIALALAAVLLGAAGDPDTTKVTLDFQNAPLTEILETLTLVSQVPVELDEAALKKLGDPAKNIVSMKCRDIPVTGAAKLLFGPRGLEVRVVDRRKLLVTVPR